jgi:hypothetical protein
MVFTEYLLTRREDSTACLGTLKVVVERAVAFVAAHCCSVTTAAKTLQLCTPRASLVHIVDQASVGSFPYLRAPQCTRGVHPEPIRHRQESTQASIFTFRAMFVYIACSRKAPVVVSTQMTQTAFSWVLPLSLAVLSIDLSIPSTQRRCNRGCLFRRGWCLFDLRNPAYFRRTAAGVLRSRDTCVFALEAQETLELISL